MSTNHILCGMSRGGGCQTIEFLFGILFHQNNCAIFIRVHEGAIDRVNTNTGSRDNEKKTLLLALTI